MGLEQIRSFVRVGPSSASCEYIGLLEFHFIHPITGQQFSTLGRSLRSFFAYFLFDAPAAYSILTPSIIMYYSVSSIALVAFTATVQAHGVILQAVGEQGQSQGFLGEYPDTTPQTTH